MKGSNSPKSRRPPKSPTSGVSFGRGETPSSPSVRFRDETQASLQPKNSRHIELGLQI